MRLTAAGVLAMGAVLVAPGIALAQDESGAVYFQTKSGKTWCYVDVNEVGCQSRFTNTPIQDGVRTNGVKVGVGGTVEYLVGDMGELPETTIDYTTFNAAGWTIEATETGTRFTNDRTSHGMFVSIGDVLTF